jgi:hypothetical protein
MDRSFSPAGNGGQPLWHQAKEDCFLLAAERGESWRGKQQVFSLPAENVWPAEKIKKKEG